MREVWVIVNFILRKRFRSKRSWSLKLKKVEKKLGKKFGISWEKFGKNVIFLKVRRKKIKKVEEKRLQTKFEKSSTFFNFFLLHLITLIKCLKGLKSQKSLFMSKF